MFCDYFIGMQNEAPDQQGSRRASDWEGLPLYAPIRRIIEVSGVPGARVRELNRQGYLRSIKFGNSRQACRLYSTKDLADALERLASGYRPRCRCRVAVE